MIKVNFKILFPYILHEVKVIVKGKMLTSIFLVVLFV
jgi:hypothetical protein